MLRIFLILCLVWGVYYYMCFPGNIIYDTGDSILYHLGIDRNNVNNSYFQNIVFGNAYLFGKALGDPKIGIAVFCTLQFVSYLVVLSYLIDRIGKLSVLMRNLVLIWYLMVPAFPIYSMTMAKDSNFALVVLLYTGLTFEMVKDPDAFFAGRVRPVLLGVSVVLIGLFRNYAHVVPTAAILCVSFFVFKNKKSRTFAISIAAITCFMVYIFPALTNAPKAQIREALSVPIQQTGYYVNHYRDEVTPEEYEKINAIVPFEALEYYDPSISDPIKNHFKADPTGEELRGYFEAWFSQFVKHPDAYLHAFYLKSYVYYIPNSDKSDVKAHVFSGFYVSNEDKPRLGLYESGSEYVDLVKSIDTDVMNIPIYGLFSKIGLYTWLLLIGIARIIQMRKFSFFACIAPAIMIIVGCLFSPVNGYYRYAYSMILSIPIIFANTILVKK